jgi:hypothetical protein
MEKQQMNNQEILDNAPEGATHWDGAKYYRYHKDDWFSFHGFEWIDANTDDLYTACSIRSLEDIKRIAEFEEALLWSRDSNTGFEPSVSVMHRYYDELLPKGGEE